MKWPCAGNAGQGPFSWPHPAEQRTKFARQVHRHSLKRCLIGDNLRMDTDLNLQTNALGHALTELSQRTAELRGYL